MRGEEGERKKKDGGVKKTYDCMRHKLYAVFSYPGKEAKKKRSSTDRSVIARFTTQLLGQ